MKSLYLSYILQKDWQHFFDLVLQKAWVGLRAEATRGYLGVLWWVLEPMLYMGVFYIAFAHVMKRGDENYVIFLLIGLVVWKWFQATVNTGSISLVHNAVLMNQVYVPKIIFPFTNIAVNTFKFTIILSIFLSLLQFTPYKLSYPWVFLPILILVQLFLIMAITCFLAAIIPFFPDLHVILDNILMMLFFLSGIFFDISKLPPSIRDYFFLNPMANLIFMYRKILIYGVMPNWHHLLGIFIFSLLIFVLAVMLLRRFDRIYPKIIH